MKKSMRKRESFFFAVAVLNLFLFVISAGSAFAGTAVLNWTAVADTDGDLAGYTIHYDTVSRAGNCPAGYATHVDVGTVTNNTLNNLPNGHVYYFQLTARDLTGNVSACSTSPGEVSKVITYPGDLDNNRNVNIFDYNTFVGGFGQTNCGNAADIDDNCIVNIFDYNLLIPDFGRSF